MIRHEVRGHTAFVTIDNPPANTWTPESLAALEKLVDQLQADRNVYAMVMTGAGAKFFSAGADLKRFNEGKEKAQQFITAFGRAFGKLMEARFVSIAAINGYAMGGGLEACLACDVRVAEEHAQLALPEPSVGLLPGGCGTQMLPRIVGEAWAKRMILTGERVDAGIALRIGLVNEVVGTGESVKAATAIADKVATLSPRAVEYCKSLIHNVRNAVPVAEGLERERERFLQLFNFSDQSEGVKAFLEKRKPEWKNN